MNCHPIIAEFYKPYNQQGVGPYPDKVILEMKDGKKWCIGGEME